MKKVVTQFIAIILVAVIAAGAGFGGACLAMSLSGSDTRAGDLFNKILGIEKPVGTQTFSAEKGERPSMQSGRPISISVGEDISIAEAIAIKVLPSVVGISTVSVENYSDNPFSFGWGFGFGEGGQFEREGVGTGVIVDEAGFILTNSHVVNDGDAKSISVSLYDGQTVEGSVVWNDSTLDLAVVKIDVDGLTAVELGDSDEIRIGSYAAAIGNPLGLSFERSMSQGIISGLDRTISVNDGRGFSVTMEGLIQTDATINHGNSGGPLLNSKGELIGINTAKAGGGEGMGFAIPINDAKPIVDQIKATGTFIRPYMGISGISLESQTAYSSEQLKEKFGVSDGIYVSGIAKGGGAETAGIKSGDVIYEVGGEEVYTMNRLNSLLIRYAPGDSVEVKLMRNGEPLSFEVVLTDGNINF